MVLFGRTGAGKSTFIEAFTGGDGSSISRGESDWTTEPRRVAWGPLELIDTPGYGGWGRTRSRQELEADAAGMVAQADLVVLCFDDQNQQSSEFAVVRDQVERFGRPCIAVLNVRNARWREHHLGPQAAATFERQVTVHARHIRDELRRMGMTNVPVVAVHMQRAAAALASDDYAGHDADLVCKRRERFSRTELAELSNVGRLEHLLVRCLADGAPRIRLQAVENDLLARVHATAEHLTTIADDTSRQVAVGVATLRSSLEVLGAGQAKPGAQRGRWSRRDVTGADALEQLAALRPELLDGISAGGRLQRTAQDLLTIHLAPHRRKLRAAGEQIAHDAIIVQKAVDGETLVRKMQRPVDQAQKAVAAALVELAEEFADQLAGLALDLQVEDARLKATPVDGRSGRKKAQLLEAGELLTQAGTAVAVLLAATGPVGWLVAAGGAVASLVMGRWRRRASRKAEARGAKVRAEAVAVVRRASDDVYGSLERRYWDSVTRVATGSAQSLIGDVATPVARQAQRQAAQTAAASALTTASPGSRRTDANAVIKAAVAAVRAAAAVGKHHDPLLGQDPTGESTQTDLQAMQDGHAALAASLQQRADNWLGYRKDPTAASDKADPLHLKVGILASNPDLANVAADGLRNEVQQVDLAVLESDGASAVDHDLLLWLLTPNIDLHTMPAAQRFFAGTSPYRHPVFARSVFCIAGLDQLGPDLVNEATALPPLLRRKADELSNYLATFGLTAAPDTILFSAPAPYGLRAANLPLDAAVFGTPQLASLLNRHPRTRWARSWHEAIALANEELARADQATQTAQGAIRQLDEVISACERSLTERRRLLQESEAALTATLGDRVDALALAVCQAPDAASMTLALDELNAWPSDAIVVEALEAWQRQFIANYEALTEEHAVELGNLLRQQRLHTSRIDKNVAGKATTFGKLLGTTSQLASKAGHSRDTWYEIVKIMSRGTYKFKPWGAIKGASAAKVLGKRLAAVGIVITAAEQYFDRRAARKRSELKEQVLTEARETVDAALADFLWRAIEDDVKHGLGLFRPGQREIDELHESVEGMRTERISASDDLEALRTLEAAAHTRLEEQTR